MKQKLLTLILLFVLSVGKSYAQPANNTCGTAQSIAVGVGSCNSILYTNVAATTAGNPPTPPCWLPNTMSNTVWFSFVATKADIELSTNFAGTLADTQIAVYSGSCGALNLIGCQEDINTATGLLQTDVILHGLTIGNTYLIAVDGKGNATGTFGICAQQTLSVGPVLPLQDCGTSQNLCGLSSISVADGPGGIGSSQESPSCFGAPGERSSSWYTFTAANNGNLCFTINPNSNIDYDFAVYNTTTSCPGTELSCNWSPTSPITGLGCTGAQCNTCLAVVAGNTYSILIDRFTAASTSGFTLDFSGTNVGFATPNPAFTANTVCVGTPTLFNNTTNTTNGNFTYSWNFGDGFTSNLRSPTHTYASANTYTATLLITAVPGGCQNSVTHSVIVAAPPTVNAGSGGTVCSGNCLTLSGSTNALGSTGVQSFNNNTTFTIPDGDVNGVYSPIAVSGIAPAAITATSIASVCINLAHTWDSDLDIYLQCPDGTLLELSTDNGFTDDNYTNTCFTPTAATSITSGTAPFTGTFAPEQPFTALNGCTANGNWQLFVVDDLGGITGSILGWTITFNNNLPPFTWSPTTGMTNANTLNPTVCPTVTTTYTLTGNSPGGCAVSNQVTVTVGSGATANISYPAASFCNTSGTQAVNLSGSGTYTGGTFSSASGLTINSITGTITPATSTAGSYTITYTIPANGGCPISTTTTTVTIRPQPNAGTDGAATICDSDTTPINLFTLITGEQTGGIWSRTSGTGGTISPVTGIFTPAAGATTSTFNYLVTGAFPCINDASSVTVTIVPQANAGADGGTIVCDSDTAVLSLSGLITGEQVGGVWTRASGLGGTFNAATGTFTPASGATTSTFTYTVIGAAPCLADTSTATITINPQPNAGADGSTTICDSSLVPVNLSTLISGQQTGGTWTRITGTGGTFNAGTGTFTPAAGATTSTFNYIVTGIAPCSADTSTATITINPLPNAGTDGAIAICGLSTAIIALPTLITGQQTGGIWTRPSGSGGTFNAAAGSFTPAPGATTSVFTYTINGISPCPSDSSNVTVTINPVLTPVVSCSTSTTSSIDINWTPVPGATGYFLSGLVNGNSSAPSVLQPVGNTTNYQLYSLAPGDNVVFSITPVGLPGTCFGTGTQTCITPTCMPPTVNISYAGSPFCTSLSTAQNVTRGGTGTFTFGTYAAPAGLTINTSNGNIIPSSSTPGSYIVTYTIAASVGCAAVTATTPVTITAIPATPALTLTQPNCTVATGIIAINAIAGLTYSFDGGAYSSALIYSGLTAGSSHFVTAQNASGCISSVSNVTLNAVPLPPAAPILTTIQPTCSVATGTVTITAIAGTTFSFDGNPYASTLIYSGLAAGSSHTVIAQNASGCISQVSNVTLNAVPSPPTAPILTTIQPTCAVATGTVTITAVVGTTFSFDGNPYAATLIYSGLAAGSSHTVTANATGCISAIANISLNAQPPTPAAPILTPTQPTCSVATGTVTITALAGTNFSFDGNPYTATLIYSGLAAGTSHTVTAQNAAGCISAVANIMLNTQPGSLTAPAFSVSEPTCTLATGSVTITAIAGLNYSFDGNPYSPTVNYTGLAAGSSHTISSQNAAGCISPVSNFTLGLQPSTPSLPILTATQPSCSVATGSISITNVPGLTYSFDGSAYTSTIVYSGLAAGSTHTVAAQNGTGCFSAIANMTLNVPPATPSVPILTATQPTCTVATGSVAITATPGLTYSFDGGAYATTVVYSNLAAGSIHTVTAQNATGCISAVSNLAINTQPVAPVAPTSIVIQPSCSISTGTITITTIPGLSYSFDGSPYSNTLIYSGLTAGSSHTVSAQNAIGCLSPVSNITIGVQPTTPAAPIVIPTQPSCTVATASISINAVSGLTYSFDGGIYATTLLYTGLAAGSVHTITARNTAGCISAVSTVTLNTQPSTPLAPIITPTQPNCNVATASLSITPVPGLTYSFDGNPYAATLIYSGLAASSTHTVTAQNASGCISPLSAFTFFAQPSTPAAPLLSATQPSCADPVGTISIGGNTSPLLYSLDGGPYSPLIVFHNMAPGTTHTIAAQSLSGCISSNASITIAPLPAPAPTPISTITQPTCGVATGTVTITGVAGETYSFDGNAYSSELVYGGLAAGSSHTIMAKDATNCTSVVSNVTLNAQPVTPVATALPNTITICSGNTTSIALSAIPGTIFSWTSVQNNVSGAVSGTGPVIAQLLTATTANPGQVMYTVTPVANGCTGLPITVSITVNPIPSVAAAPTAQTICSGENSNIVLNSPDGNGVSFNWTVIQNGVSGATSGGGNSILQTLTATGNLGTATYTVTPVKNGCSGIPVSVVVTVKPRPEVVSNTLYTICDGDSANIILSASIPGTDFSWTTVENNVTGAIGGTGNTINQPLTLTGNSAGTVIYTVAPTLAGCAGNTQNVRVNVNPLPEPLLKDGIICVEQASGNAARTFILDSGLSNSAYHFEWTLDNQLILGANANSYEASLPGRYSVIAFNNQTGCISEEVFASVSAAFVGDGLVVTVTDAFSENASITVTVPIGTGPFYYQLDNGPLQQSNVFARLHGGVYTVKVTDVNGCTDLQQEVTVIDYPRFFTPNGDGYNDTWNIFSLKDSDSKIYVFDRYGKLLKEISPDGKGWDGTYNGQELPATDYWFTTEYPENGIKKGYRSHFSLKR